MYQKNRCIFNTTNQLYKYFYRKHSHASPESKISPLTHCLNLVRKYDYDNYLCTLLLPDNIRPAAIAIRAFNIELSKIQERTNEHAAGVMRAKFWEDSLERIYNDQPLNHPVLIEVHRAIKRHKLSKLFLQRLVSSRLKQLNVSTFKDIKEMENYADQTCSTVLMLLLEALNVRDINCDHVASHIGKAQGLTNLLRALPYNLKERIVLLPRTELIKHDISEESLMRNSVDPQALSNVVFEIASVANNHLKLAESIKDNVPTVCKSIFLPAVPVRHFLNSLEKFNFHIYEPKLSVRYGLLPILLSWKKFTKSY